MTDEVNIVGFGRFGFKLRERMEVSVGLICLVDRLTILGGSSWQFGLID